LVSEKESGIIVMSRWMEVIGLLLHLEERDDELLAEVGTLVVAFPQELKEALYPHLGSKIGILRTDENYLVIPLPEEMQNLSKIEPALDCCEVT
jgi:hypothetical protein